MKTVKAVDLFDEVITEQGLQQAREQGRKRRNAGLLASTVEFLPAQKALLIGFADQCAIALPVRNYPELAHLSIQELESLELGFGGSAVCLEARDLHVSIAGLISASVPLMEMAACMIAARNGSRSSSAKAQAARQNGAKGGRPRKLVTG
ncbi:hypothetical protein AFK24_19070 [Pseudomonas syringae]|uniref:DUF2442 domain-containing protein n=1 Tax=Pseudomonas syringae TaxID=317 RepID=A0A1C7Z0M9_PSESX|nr:DUF2442 domain-containing protein [Pseudomonas syringae]OCR23481.1 hypothetical protein AFK24_19070 [Pseudomonas syringae]